MKAYLRLLALSVAAGTLLAPTGGTQAQLLITSNDEKVASFPLPGHPASMRGITP